MRERVDDVSQALECVKVAREKLKVEKRNLALAALSEKRQLQQRKQRSDEAEIQRKKELIHQIKLLEKVLRMSSAEERKNDLTRSGERGLLGEMSIAELQERILSYKLLRQQQNQSRRDQIIMDKIQKEQEMLERLKRIQMFENHPQRELHLTEKTSRDMTAMLSDPQIDELREKLERLKAARNTSATPINT